MALLGRACPGVVISNARSFLTAQPQHLPPNIPHFYNKRRKLPSLPNQLFKVDLTPTLPDGCTFSEHERTHHPPTHILRRKLPSLPNQLFKVDLTPSLPDGCPVTVSRWLEVPNNTTAFAGPSLPTSDKRPHPAATWLPGEVHVWFEVAYGGGAAGGKGGGLDIGALGFSMPLVRRCGWRRGGVGLCEEVWGEVSWKGLGAVRGGVEVVGC